MFDPFFGSHYAQSAIDLAVRASSFANPPEGVEPNNAEAIRLYNAAIEDSQMARLDFDKYKEQLPNFKDLMEEMHHRDQIWLATIEQLKGRKFIRDAGNANKKHRRPDLSDIHGADRIPTGKLAQVERLLREGKQVDAAEMLHVVCIEYELKSYEAHQLGQYLLARAKKYRTGNGPFVVDEANCDDEHFYVDVNGKGSVQIMVKEDGLLINVYPFTVEDVPAGTLFVFNRKLCGTS